MSESIKHLLIPKQFKVYCLPNRGAGTLSVTNLPSKATCANCLTMFRRKSGKRKAEFKVAHTGSRASQDDNASPHCAICGGRIYLENPAEGYSCSQCGASDSDE